MKNSFNKKQRDFILKRHYSYNVSFFKPSQRVQAFVFFLASNIKVKHYVFNCNSWFAKIFVPLIEVFHNGFFKFTASPSSVAYQDNNGPDERLFV